MRKIFAVIVVAAMVSGCSPNEEWLLVAQGNRVDPTAVLTKFAVSTGRTFGAKSECTSELARLETLSADGNLTGLVQDEHVDIRLDYFCMRVR